MLEDQVECDKVFVITYKGVESPEYPFAQTACGIMFDKSKKIYCPKRAYEACIRKS